tara:strand:+ start:278 stop:676 length:399 start_codon:yes stop_codon:yes gene_type:complete
MQFTETLRFRIPCGEASYYYNKYDSANYLYLCIDIIENDNNFTVANSRWVKIIKTQSIPTGPNSEKILNQFTTDLQNRIDANGKEWIEFVKQIADNTEHIEKHNFVQRQKSVIQPKVPIKLDFEKMFSHLLE